MSNDGAEAGCGLLFIAALAWVAFHFSGYSVLILRDEKLMASGGILVECRYLNSTGTESIYASYLYQSAADRFFCKRVKKVGE